MFGAVEINSSFYRSHRPETYARWAAAVPEHFRFAVKLPKEITHVRRLVDVADPLEGFLFESGHLGGKRGPLLVQLPPKLEFDPAMAREFFSRLRDGFSGSAVCEPRNPTWFAEEAETLLAGFEVARVAADPAPVPEAARPGGWEKLRYHRLHGSPRTYYSAYAAERLDAIARSLEEEARDAMVWCIFDNTASGAAAGNAADLLAHLEP